MLARLHKYLRDLEFRIHEMAELAPGVIVVHDDYGDYGGEFDTYIDTEAIVPTQPETWGEDGLSTPSLKHIGLGVLQGVAFDPIPKSVLEFFRIAPQLLTGKKVPIIWYETPKPLEVPQDLRA